MVYAPKNTVAIKSPSSHLNKRLQTVSVFITVYAKCVTSN